MIDRPIGSRHPRHGFEYPVNYGYVQGTKAPDGEEIDAYLLGIAEPLADCTGVCIAVIHRLDDDDDKLVLAPEGTEISDEEIKELTHFQEQWFVSEIVRLAPKSEDNTGGVDLNVRYEMISEARYLKVSSGPNAQ